MVIKWNITIPALSGSVPRRAYVWLPEDYKTSGKRYPVLYMFDGHNVFFDEDATYGKSWGMAAYLTDHPKDLIVAAVECNYEGNQRLVEYTPMPRVTCDLGTYRGRGKETFQWLIGEFKPYIDKRFRTLPDRKNTLIAGSSMGGLMALYGVTAHNAVFQRGACLSPSLWVDPGKVLEFVARSRIRGGTNLYMDYGEKELRNHDASQLALTQTNQLLLAKGVNLTFRVVPGGEHCEASWEQQIPVFFACLGL